MFKVHLSCRNYYIYSANLILSISILDRKDGFGIKIECSVVWAIFRSSATFRFYRYYPLKVILKINCFAISHT